MNDKTRSDNETEITLLRQQINELHRRLAQASSKSPGDDADHFRLVSEREQLMLEAERIAHMGSWVWDVQTNQVVWSDELYRILGYDPEKDSPTVEAFYAAVHPDDLQRVREVSAEASKSGVTPRLEHRILRSDGTVKMVTSDAASIYDSKGQLRRLVGTILDVTERREAEEKLLRANEELEEAQALAHIGSWNFDLKTNVIHWSKEFRNIIGVDHSMIPTATEFYRHVHPDDVARSRAMEEEALATGKRVEIELRLIRPDEEIRHIRIAALPVRNEHDEIIRIKGTMQDFTELHRLRERLIEAERMEAIGRLAGGIAHDFNNLMMVVRGNLELLEAHDRPELKAIFDAVKAAQTLTTSLLAFGRKAQLQKQVIDLNVLVENTVTLLHRLIGTHIELQMNLVPQALWVDVDSSMFQQALINLVINARDAINADGSIFIVTSAIQKQGRSFAELVVRDTGGGIDPKIKARIFEPFFTTKSVGAGTGMGLAMVHGTVLQHGGSIEVESQPGKETAFHIRIPAAMPPQQATTSATSSTADCSGAGRTVLVVDDKPEVLSLVSTVLQRSGYNVLSADSPCMALSIIKQQQDIDLAICDLVMPEMHGTALAEKLKQIRPSLLVTYMSGYGGNAVKLPLGSKLLNKPFSLDELIRFVANALVDRK
ncbi:MAG TPA: PAS domain-containing protein [Steroidobacteraceae bacterium]|nr:PAS domain-containing protein [Steroidobacteraceae bacterium]